MGERIPTVEVEDESRPTVAFRPHSLRQKAEWERAVAQSGEYSNMSHLIRRSVNRELDGEHAVSSDDTGVSAERFDSLTESVERIEARLGNIGDAVDRLETATYAEGGLSDETLQAVFAELPTGEAEAHSGHTTSTVSEIAEEVELAPETVELALGKLRSDMEGTVKFVDRPDVRHWFREA